MMVLGIVLQKHLVVRPPQNIRENLHKMQWLRCETLDKPFVHSLCGGMWAARYWQIWKWRANTGAKILTVLNCFWWCDNRRWRRIINTFNRLVTSNFLRCMTQSLMHTQNSRCSEPSATYRTLFTLDDKRVKIAVGQPTTRSMFWRCKHEWSLHKLAHGCY